MERHQQKLPFQKSKLSQPLKRIGFDSVHIRNKLWVSWMTNRLLILSLAIALSAAALPFKSRGAADSEFFESKIRPVLAEHCYECHSASSKKLKGGLRVD